jgi:hypothetical protein
VFEFAGNPQLKVPRPVRFLISMTKTMKKLLFVLTALAMLSLASAPALAFNCGSGAGGSCACKGRADCKDMRRSEMCKSDLTCGKGKCTCTAALVEDPDAGGEVTGGLKDALGKKPVLNAQ